MFIKRNSIGILSRSTIFFAPPGEKGGDNPPAATLEERLTAAESNVAGLTSKLVTVENERETARTSLAAMTTERDTLKTQFDGLTATANQHLADLNTARGQITTLTTERDNANTALATANGNVARLTSLCELKGINPAAAVPAGNPNPAESKSSIDFQTRIAAAKTQKEKDAILAEFSTAAKAGTVAE